MQEKPLVIPVINKITLDNVVTIETTESISIITRQTAQSSFSERNQDTNTKKTLATWKQDEFIFRSQCILTNCLEK